MPAASASANAVSPAAAANGHGVAGSTRPATHSAAIAASLLPVGVDNPVQLQTAVSRNPAITATAYPKIISCACQSGSRRYKAPASQPAKCAVHSASASTANTPARSEERRVGKE